MPLAAERSAIFASPILIVEDNEVNRLVLEKTLRSRGFSNLQSAVSAEDALTRMERFTPELVLLDIMMPGMDGFEFCRLVRSRAGYKDLPILVQTSLTKPELRVKAFEAGATDFVSKPIYPDELYARVKVHLQNRLYVKSLQLYKTRIATELEAANRLQFSILPQKDETDEIEERCGIEIASYFKLSSEIGGDFWGVKNIFPNQVACWMVDFSGHGVASALNAFRLHAYLKEHSQLSARPGEYLSHMNDKLLNLLMRGQFATMFYGIIDTQGNQLLYACAATPGPIIIRKSGGKVETLDGSGFPLGVGMQLYPTQTVPFFPGDTLVLYSDALIETPDASGKWISEETVMELVSRHKDASAAALVEALTAHFTAHSGGVTSDDLTFCVCKRK